MSDSDCEKHGWRHHWRWWHIVIAVSVMLVVGVCAWAAITRSVGRLRYDHVIATIKEAGRPTTIADLVAGMSYDGRLRDDWESWQQRFKKSRLYHVDIAPKNWALWVAGERAQAPQNTRTELAKGERIVEEGRALLKRGPLNLSLLGWMARNLPSKPLETFDASLIHLPNLRAIRYVAEWLRHDALVSGHQDDDLVDLDRLYLDQSRPACLIGALLMGIIANVRDQTYVELEVKGLLSEKSRVRWLAQDLDFPAMYAEGFQGERILWLGAVADRLSRSLRRWPEDYPPGLRHAVHDWIFGYFECANEADAEDQYALRLRHLAGRVPFLVDIRATQSAGIVDRIYPNVATRALIEDASHRMSRVAMSILTLLDAGGTLPSSQAQLLNQLEVARDLNPGGDHFRIEYERLSGDRFRITLDPSSLVPDFIDAQEYTERVARAHGPADIRPFAWTSNRMEIRVSGRQH